MTAARTTELSHGITAVDTDYVRPLLDASHLIVENGRAAFVDTGTNNSVRLLLEALAGKDIDAADVDYVFLTHVHLDHAGGAGLLMQSLPNAKAVVHPRGARHMIDPEKLIKGAKAVYGEPAYSNMYGELQPIPEARVVIPEDGDHFELAGRPFDTFYTEGHARHHYCLHDPTSNGVFTGDSFGISYRELDTAAGEFIFPTTTPVHFDPVEAHRSIDLIMAKQPQQLYLTHYSRVTDLERLAEDMHVRINVYCEIAKRQAEADDRTAAIETEMSDYLFEEACAHGFPADRERFDAVTGMDVKLNTQGLEFWLDNGSPTDRKA